MKYKTFKLTIEGAVARLTLNRPNHANAMTFEMGHELVAAMSALRNEPLVRVLVITGAGGHFCAGADLAEFKRLRSLPPEEVKKKAEQNPLMHAIQALHQLPIPVVARINGDAYGGGVGLALACDLRVMSSTARLGFIFPRVGISSADGGVTYFLPRLIGLARATEILLLGQEIDSKAAFEMNLIHHSVAPEELNRVTDDLVARLAAAAPIATRFTKEGLTQSLARSIDEEFRFEHKALAACLLSDDHWEGVQALSEQRTPQFKGK
jgi:enoyl-CoA hydratase/carnithine racemase